MFGNIKQKIKHVIKEQKEARDAYKTAQHEEMLRVQHLASLKKLESKRQRLASAKVAGVKSQTRLEVVKREVEKLKTKADPFLKLLIEKAKHELKQSLRSRPIRKKKRKSKKGRKQGYR